MLKNNTKNNINDKFFSTSLINWYKKNKRDLPWRKNVTSKDYVYRVLISEFMLQQTTVSTVIPYFNKFIKKWPSIKKLSKANLDEVLLSWQGLGYYTRAKNLLKTSNFVCNQYNAIVPSSLKNLKELPGIGDYSAAAIRSIGYNKKAVAVDGNVKRVIARYYGLKGTSKDNSEIINQIASRICPDRSNRVYTQAIMELGAIICKPRKYNCKKCCLKKNCLSYKQNIVHLIPSKKIKLHKEKLNCISFLILDQHKSVLMKKRKDTKLLANQWELPSTNWVKKPLKFSKIYTPFPKSNWKNTNFRLKHIFSHLELENAVYISEKKIGEVSKNFKDSEWIDNCNIKKIVVTTMTKKILKKFNLVQT